MPAQEGQECHMLTPQQVAMKAEFSFTEFRDLYPQINGKLPVLSSDLSQFPKNLRVQEPLMLIFEAYLACYAEMIRAVSTEEDGKS